MLKRFTAALVLTLTIVVANYPPVVLAEDQGAQTATQSAACDGVEIAGGECGQNAGSDINNILSTVINLFSIVVGFVAVLMIIIGGLKYITSGGDSSSVSSAKNTLLYAVVGLVIVALAQFIVRFVLNKSTGITGPPTP